MKLAAFLIALIPLVFVSSTASAEVKIEQTGNSSVKVNVNSNSNSNSYSNIISNSNISIHTSTSGSSGDNEVEINNDAFKIKGTVTAVSSNSFSVNNQKVFKDSSKLQFSQEGSLEVGKNIETEGKIFVGDLYASKIKTSGEGNSNPGGSNTKIEVNNKSLDNDQDETESPNSSASASASPSPKTVKEEIQNPIQQILKAIENLISFLNKLTQ